MSLISTSRFFIFVNIKHFLDMANLIVQVHYFYYFCKYFTKYLKIKKKLFIDTDKNDIRIKFS